MHGKAHTGTTCAADHPISNVEWLLLGIKFNEAGGRNRCKARACQSALVNTLAQLCAEKLSLATRQLIAIWKLASACGTEGRAPDCAPPRLMRHA